MRVRPVPLSTMRYQVTKQNLRKTNVFKHCLLSVVAALMVACSGGGGSVSTNPVPVVTISASSTSIAFGNPVVISYSCTNCTSATASGGWSDTLSPTGGTVTKNPTTTTTYTITGSGPGGTSSPASVTVTVVPPPNPTITATPGIILQGQTTVIGWNGDTGTSVSVSGPGMNTSTALTGSVTVTPPAKGSNVYTITSTNVGGTKSASVTVTVNAPTPTATLTPSTTSVTLGTSLTLNAVTTNADIGCTIAASDGSASGAVTCNGTITVTPTSTTGSVTYTLTANGSGGSVTASSGTIAVVNTAITLTSANPWNQLCVGQCLTPTVTFIGTNFAAGQLVLCTPDPNIQLIQLLSSTQIKVTLGIDQVHEGSGYRSCKICKSDGTGCSNSISFGLYSSNMCDKAVSGEMFCLNPQETVAGQHVVNGIPQNGYVDKFTPAGVPDGKFFVNAPTCCIAVDNITGFVIVDATVYDQNGNRVGIPQPQGFPPQPVVANAAKNGIECVLQPLASVDLSCVKITGPATPAPVVTSTNVGSNLQSLAIVVAGSNTYVDVIAAGSSPALWSVDTSTMATNTSQPLVGVTANLPGGSAITPFDSLGIVLVTSFGDKMAVPFNETTLKQGSSITLPGIPVSATATSNSIALIGNADNANTGGTFTEVDPVAATAIAVPSIEAPELPVGVVAAPTGKMFFACPQDGVTSCSAFSLP